jgi:hypothetical protein
MTTFQPFRKRLVRLQYHKPWLELQTNNRSRRREEIASGAGKALNRQFGPIAGALARRPDGVGLVMTLPYANHAVN